MLKKYYLAVATEKSGKKTIASSNANGALLFAVYRGKVSEGLDFVDDNARCVVAVGQSYRFI